MNKVTITVSGPVGSGKSAICGEIEILCKALGVHVEWVGGREEKNLTHADWTEALEMYKPSVTIIEDIARAALVPTEAAAEPCEHSAWVDGVWDCNVCGKHVERPASEPKAVTLTAEQRNAIFMGLYLVEHQPPTKARDACSKILRALLANRANAPSSDIDKPL